MLPKRANERGSALHGAHITAGTAGKIAQIHGAVSGHGVVFEVTSVYPEAFGIPCTAIVSHAYIVRPFENAVSAHDPRRGSNAVPLEGRSPSEIVCWYDSSDYAATAHGGRADRHVQRD